MPFTKEKRDWDFLKKWVPGRIHRLRNTLKPNGIIVFGPHNPPNLGPAVSANTMFQTWSIIPSARRIRVGGSCSHTPFTIKTNSFWFLSFPPLVFFVFQSCFYLSVSCSRFSSSLTLSYLFFSPTHLFFPFLVSRFFFGILIFSMNLIVHEYPDESLVKLLFGSINHLESLNDYKRNPYIFKLLIHFFYLFLSFLSSLSSVFFFLSGEIKFYRKGSRVENWMRMTVGVEAHILEDALERYKNWLIRIMSGWRT